MTYNFYAGFEKAAAAKSLIGINKNLMSGLRRFEQGAKVKTPTTINPGQAIAPRSELPHIPTMSAVSNEHNLKPHLPVEEAQRVKIPKAKRRETWQELKPQG